MSNYIHIYIKKLKKYTLFEIPQADSVFFWALFKNGDHEPTNLRISKQGPNAVIMVERSNQNKPNKKSYGL